MTDWGELRSEFTIGRWGGVFNAIEQMIAPTEDIARYLWDLMIQDHEVAPFLYSEGVRRISRNERKGHQEQRLSEVVAWWKSRVFELEARAFEDAQRAGEPVGLMFFPHITEPWRVLVSRDFFERVPGEVFITEHTMSAPPMQEEWRFVMTHEGDPCVVTRSTEVELRDYGYWSEDAEAPEHATFMAAWIEITLSRLDEGAFKGDRLRLSASVYDDVLAALRVGPDDIVWCPEELAFQPHVVMHQDDNGHDFEVETFPSRHAAAARVLQLESAMHKQHYWIDPVG